MHSYFMNKGDHMNPKLFQSAEFYHRRYHNFATVLVIPMTLLVFFLLAFSLIGKKEITVTTLGSIRPTKVIAVVQSSSNNTVLTNNLSENKAVKKGIYSSNTPTNWKIVNLMPFKHKSKDMNVNKRHSIN